MSTPSALTMPNFIAGGNVARCRFISRHSTGFNTVIQASAATQLLVGISADWTKYPPGSVSDTAISGLHAQTGDQVSYHGPLQMCLLELGGTVSDPRIPLTSDADGKGVATAPSDGTTVYYGALPLEAGVSGDKIKVWVLPPTITV